MRFSKCFGLLVITIMCLCVNAQNRMLVLKKNGADFISINTIDSIVFVNSANDGSAKSPLTISETFNLAHRVGARDSLIFYVHGFITQVQEVSIEKREASFYVSDLNSNVSGLLVDHCRCSQNLFSLSAGDEVVICGQYSYRSDNNQEQLLFTNSYLYSINGKIVKDDETSENFNDLQNDDKYNEQDNIVFLNDKTITTSKINNAIRVGRNGDKPSEITPLMLLHFSDIHGKEQNLARIKQFYDYYSTYINDVICTGDMVYGKLVDGLEFWNNCHADSFMMCVGNHETYKAGNQPLDNPADVYNTIFKPYIDKWNVVQPENAEESSKCYYYKDYIAPKVRLIVLDAYDKGNSDYLSAENAWFQSALSDAISQNLSVLVAIHPMTGSVKGFDCTFNAIQKGYSGANYSDLFKQSVDTFINNGGEFVAWIGGHGHIDVCGVDRSYQNQVRIAVDAASQSQSNSYSDTYRSSNIADSSFDCFNLLTIDTYQKLIKIIRIGANMDSFMRKKEMMTILYKSTTGPMVISNY